MRGIAYKYIIYFLFQSKLKLLKCLSLKYHLFFRLLLQCTLNPHQNQGLIRFLFIWTLVPIQKRFGRFTMSQISRNGQLYTEPTFQVIRKDNSGTFEKYQQLRIGDYGFKKFCFLKEDLLNGELEMRENKPQFDKNIGMEHVLEQCHKVREISIGRNRRLYVTFIQYIKDNPASTYVQIRLFCRKENNDFKLVTYVSYTLDEFKELIQNLKDFSNIQQCTFQ